ncbi:OLC1v1025298C1 [Oldenlandia corymbosa var. corymbosa]|uniref:OLC1v1025298C1 n=1 Tax=Oldenlandia corymbosa var. corymbosa TaxID=529605 RepID=A0AAV1C5A4_OLDCO|nr:OLC1v1025298C1 [Oldenlandia corymbosa var. corymbosa]
MARVYVELDLLKEHPIRIRLGVEGKETQIIDVGADKPPPIEKAVAQQANADQRNTKDVVAAKEAQPPDEAAEHQYLSETLLICGHLLMMPRIINIAAPNATPMNRGVNPISAPSIAAQIEATSPPAMEGRQESPARKEDHTTSPRIPCASVAAAIVADFAAVQLSHVASAADPAHSNLNEDKSHSITLDNPALSNVATSAAKSAKPKEENLIPTNQNITLLNEDNTNSSSPICSPIPPPSPSKYGKVNSQKITNEGNAHKLNPAAPEFSLFSSSQIQILQVLLSISAEK